MSESAKKGLSLVSILAVLTLVAFLAFDLPTSAAQQAQKSQQQGQQASDDASDAEQAGAEDGEDTAEKKKEQPPIPVAVTVSERGDVSSYLSATANLVPENEVEVLAEWEGRLAKLNVDEGQHVEAGQILAELARGDAEIAFQKAEVRTDTARLAFERAEKLKAQELLSPEEYEKAAQAFRIAEQEKAEAQWRLEKTYIRAPFSGYVTQRNVQLGQHLRPGDSLFRVADFEPLVARIYLPEKDVLALAEGRSVRLGLRADDQVVFQGRIQKISPVVDTATGTVKVTIEARQVPRAVRPGAFVKVDIVETTRNGAVLVPREAVVRELQSTYVFVANGDGVAEKRSVELGLEEDGRVEAVSGISEGEQVIVAGQGGLKDGAKIKTVDAVG